MLIAKILNRSGIVVTENYFGMLIYYYLFICTLKNILLKLV